MKSQIYKVVGDQHRGREMDEHYSEGQVQKRDDKIEREWVDTNRAEKVGIKNNSVRLRKWEEEDEMSGVQIPNEPIAMETEKVVVDKIRVSLKEMDQNIPPTGLDGKGEKSGDIKGKWKRLARDVTGEVTNHTDMGVENMVSIGSKRGM